MSTLNVPLANPKPDCGRFIRSLTGQEKTSRPPLIEYLVDDMLRKPIIEMIGREWVNPGADRESQMAYWDNFVAFWQHMGYDFVRLEIGMGFSTHGLVSKDTAPGSDKMRGWVDQHHGTITSWEDFEKYPWPKLEDVDFFPMEYVNAHMPEGMGLISCHGGGPYEHLSAIFSYEQFCYALVDQPDLVQAVIDRIGALMEGYYRMLLDLDRLIVVFPGDDMGFKTGTLISPQYLIKYTLPWHQRFAAMAHEKGKPYFLHSCGNLETIMPHLINEVGIDAKHSYEDAIIPVAEMQRRYGDRIAILGGIDVDILTRGTPDEVRKYVRGVIDVCGPRGRYAVGSGNSIPSYIPLENYMTMIDEALR